MKAYEVTAAGPDDGVGAQRVGLSMVFDGPHAEQKAEEFAASLADYDDVRVRSFPASWLREVA